MTPTLQNPVGGIGGDFFHRHFDEIAAAQSAFGQRIVHGHLVLSAAAGRVVSPAPGPVPASDGLDNPRFVKPVGIGDTRRARPSAKRSTDRRKSGPDGVGQGMVARAAAVSNPHDAVEASHDVLTLVAKRS